MADPDHDYTAARTSFLHVSLAALLLLAAAACGGDDGDNKPVDTGKSGTGGGSALGGASGSTTAGAGGGAAMPQPVACGSGMCYPRSNPLSAIIGMAGAGLGNLLPMALPCCIDSNTGACGTTMTMGGTCEPPAIADSRCPGIDLGAAAGAAGGAIPGLGGLMMGGCCIDNMCGQDGMLFGRGCVENSQAMSMLSSIPLIGTLARVPATLACDRPMDMTPKDDRDAGADDAGH